MLTKPFRSPLLRQAESIPELDRNEIPRKRQRISNDNETTAELSGPRLVFKTPGISSLPRKPLVTVPNPAADGPVTTERHDGARNYYNVLW